MSQGYVTTRAVTVNLNGTSDTGTVVTGGNVGGSPVFMTYIPSATGLFPAEAANLVWAGPATGSAALPTFRALVAADIPAIPQSGVTGLVAALASKATDSLVVHLAGIESITGVKTFTANPVFNAGGIPNASVAGLAASATTDTTNAANISSGTLPSGRLVGAYTGVTGLGTLSALTNFTTGVQLNALVKMSPTATDGIALVQRSDGANPSAGAPVGWLFGNTNPQGFFLGAFANADARFLAADQSTDNVTLRANNFRASGYVEGAQFRLNFTNTVGIVQGATLQFAFNNGTIGSSTNSDSLLLFATTVDAASFDVTPIPASISNYIYNSRNASGATRVITLPATPYVGQRIGFQAYNSKAMKIVPNTSQTIQIGTTVSSVGALGSATSATNGATCWLVYTVTNTWEADSSSGTWTVA